MGYKYVKNRSNIASVRNKSVRRSSSVNAPPGVFGQNK